MRAKSNAPRANHIQNDKHNTTHIKKQIKISIIKKHKSQNPKIQNSQTSKNLKSKQKSKHPKFPKSKHPKIPKSICLARFCRCEKFWFLEFWIFAVVHRCLITVMDKWAKSAVPRVVGGVSIYLFIFIHIHIYMHRHTHTVYLPQTQTITMFPDMSTLQTPYLITLDPEGRFLSMLFSAGARRLGLAACTALVIPRGLWQQPDGQE